MKQNKTNRIAWKFRTNMSFDFDLSCSDVFFLSKNRFCDHKLFFGKTFSDHVLVSGSEYFCPKGTSRGSLDMREIEQSQNVSVFFVASPNLFLSRKLLFQEKFCVSKEICFSDEEKKHTKELPSSCNWRANLVEKIFVRHFGLSETWGNGQLTTHLKPSA